MTAPRNEGDELAALARLVAQAKRALADAKLAEQSAEAEHDRLEAQLFDTLEARNLRSIKTSDGTFSLNDLAWPRITDMELARRWAEAENPELIILNHQRLVGFVRTAIKEGNELPPGLDYSTSRKIRWTKVSE